MKTNSFIKTQELHKSYRLGKLTTLWIVCGTLCLMCSSCSYDTYCVNDSLLYFQPDDVLTEESKQMIVQHNTIYEEVCK